MNKQNKLILRAVKAALRVVEAAEKARVRQDIEYGTSSTLRPGGTYSPNTQCSPEPPTGKILFHQGNGCPELRGCEALGPFTSRVLNAQLEEIKRLKNPLKEFAGDDTPYVEKLLEPLDDTPRTLVHLKSPELGTETLVVLSPEGETLLKIVKDNSRKFEVK